MFTIHLKGISQRNILAGVPFHKWPASQLPKAMEAAQSLFYAEYGVHSKIITIIFFP